MTSWKTYKITDIGRIVTGKTPKTSIQENYGGDIPFLTPSDDLSGKYSPKTSKTLTQVGLSEVKNCLLPANSICVSCIGSDLGKVVKVTQPTVTNQQFNSIIPSCDFDADFVYYLMTIVGKQLNYLSKTSTAVPIINKTQFSNFEVRVPSLEEQRRIAGILGAIDDKIENNRRINDNLEQQTQTLFDEWFVNDSTQPAEYNRASLTDIANYLNGLAMQRFRPQSDEKAIPVLKIKELGQGMCDSSSDICSQSIDSKYIVNDGDIIFSWSGTLLVDIWCGGICGLNQHLFKVTSDKYPKWFVYYWTKYHLAKFIRIAKDKAVTMGHIKRGDLETSEVLIPNAEILSKMDNIIAPIFDAIISRRVENKTLATLRDTLLPKLMNGEIKL